MSEQDASGRDWPAPPWRCPDDPEVRTDRSGVGVECIDDLPDHPNDRICPGPSREGHEFVADLLPEFAERTLGQLVGLLVVAETTVFVHAEDEGVAAREAVENAGCGDLYSVCIDTPTGPVEDRILELHNGWPDDHVESWYSEDDDDWPVYQCHLLAAGRFYMWATDDAEVSEVAPRIVDPGRFGHCAVVNTWLADLDEVDLTRLAVQRAEVKEVEPDA